MSEDTRKESEASWWSEAEAARSQEARLQLARLEGRLESLQSHVASLEAEDEHRRAELAGARAEAADAQAAIREAQARVEESKRLMDELRKKAELAEAARSRAEDERTAVIAALGWRARRRLKGRS